MENFIFLCSDFSILPFLSSFSISILPKPRPFPQRWSSLPVYFDLGQFLQGLNQSNSKQKFDNRFYVSPFEPTFHEKINPNPLSSHHTFFSKPKRPFFAHIESGDYEHLLYDSCFWITPLKDFKDLNDCLIPNYTPSQYFP